jgi:hypothetical protein
MVGMALQTEGEWKQFRGGKLIVHYLSNKKRNTIYTGHACGPAFSEDGRRISFIDIIDKNKKGTVMTCNIDGSDLKKITDCEGGIDLAVTYWLPDDYIYFNHHNNVIHRVKATGGTREVFFQSGKQIHQFGISNDGKRIAWTQPQGYKVMVYDFETKKERTTGDDCQGTMSPDGNFFTRNLGGHKSFAIHKFEDMSVLKKFNALGGSGHNLHRWAHYSQDNVVYTKEGGGSYGVIHNIQTDQAIKTGPGTIWDYYEKEYTSATPVLESSSNKKDKKTADGILVRQSLNRGELKVYLPSDGIVNIELLRLNGVRISSSTIKGAGWFNLPVSFANKGVLIVRIKNDKKATIFHDAVISK